MTLAAGQPNPHALAVDASFAYWTNFVVKEGSVVKVPLSGGEPVTLAAHESAPAGVAVDATNVYWTRSALNDLESTALGAVMKLPLGGGAPVALAQDLPDPESLVLTSTDIFWSDWDGLKRVAKSSPSTP